MTRNEAINVLRVLASELRDGLKHLKPEHEKQFEEAYMIAIEALDRKHGEWIDGLDVPKEERERHPYVYLHGEKYCSVCYKEAYFDTDYGQQLFDYCPHCGARMVSI